MTLNAELGCNVQTVQTSQLDHSIHCILYSVFVEIFKISVTFNIVSESTRGKEEMQMT